MTDRLVTDVWPHAEALKGIRKQAGLSVERAAGIAGATRSSWHAWEAGTRRPSDESLKAIVEAFECPPELVGYEPPRGWTLVPEEWVRSEFTQLHAELNGLREQLIVLGAK